MVGTVGNLSADKVPLATSPASKLPEIVPLAVILPVTSNFSCGSVFPIPTLKLGILNSLFTINFA